MVTWVELVDAEAESQPSNPCRRQRAFEEVITLSLTLMSLREPAFQNVWFQREAAVSVP